MYVFLHEYAYNKKAEETERVRRATETEELSSYVCTKQNPCKKVGDIYGHTYLLGAYV